MNPTRRSGRLIERRKLADVSVPPTTETMASIVQKKIPRIRKLEITSSASVPQSKISRMDSSGQSPVNRRKAVRAFRKTIPQLPEEILVAIMKWLTVDERKNAKAVCKDWFFASTAYDKGEKFCFGKEDSQRNLDEILLTLSRSTRQSFHLEFYGARFGGIPRIEFWRTCGSKIISLKLMDCIISGPCFVRLLRYCCNLRTLEFYFDDLDNMKNGLEIQISLSVIMTCTAETIRVRPDDQYEYLMIHSDLDKASFWDLIYDSLVEVDRLTQITEVSVDWDFQMHVDENLFLKFAQKQVNLKKITNVTKESVDERILNSFVTAVLKIPSLREIQIFFYNDEIQWKDRWSSLFSESNVEILRIVCRKLMFPETPSADSHRRNEKLKILAIRAASSFDSSILLLLVTFPNLRELCLSHVNDDVLKSVCDNQTELRTLTIEEIVDRNPLKNLNCLNRLKNLRKLEIPETIMLKNCDLSGLKNLRVKYKFCKEHDQSDLQIYQSLSSPLDALWIETIRLQNPVFDKKNCNPRSYASWEKERVLWYIDLVTELVKSLPNLKFLYIGNVIILDSYMTRVIESDVCPIFSLCPLLRVFGFNRDVFAKDVITNRIHQNCDVSERELMQRFMNVNEEFDFHYRGIHLYP